jgi:hypothetical protein
MRRRTFLLGLLAASCGRRNVLNALDFSSLQTAITAASGRGRLVIPYGTYTTSGMTIPSNVEIETDGPVIIQTSNAAPVLDCSSAVNFCIRGNLTLQGGGPAYTGYGTGPSSDLGQIGIKLNNSDRYEISGKIEIKNMVGAGILRTNSAGGWQHQGRIAGVRVRDSYYGMNSGSSAEYETISDCMFDNNVFGILEDSGNNTYVNCKTRFNSIGVKLTGGTNNAHGIFTALESNHNTYNLTLMNVTNGHTFSGCHFIADQSGSGHGIIQIINCKGINITGGQLGSDISIDSTSSASVQSMYVRSTLTNAPSVSSGGVLVAKNNWTDTGLVSWNT